MDTLKGLPNTKSCFFTSVASAFFKATRWKSQFSWNRYQIMLLVDKGSNNNVGLCKVILSTHYAAINACLHINHFETHTFLDASKRIWTQLLFEAARWMSRYGSSSPSLNPPDRVSLESTWSGSGSSSPVLWSRSNFNTWSGCLLFNTVRWCCLPGSPRQQRTCFPAPWCSSRRRELHSLINNSELTP